MQSTSRVNLAEWETPIVPHDLQPTLDQFNAEEAADRWHAEQSAKESHLKEHDHEDE